MEHVELSQKLASGELLLSKKTSRSRVWLLFSPITNREGEKLGYVWCKSCKKAYKHTHAQTSNLVRHSCFLKKFANPENTESTETKETTAKIDNTEISITEEVNDNNLTKLLTKCVTQNCISNDLMQSDSVKAVYEELLALGAKFGSDVDVEDLLPSVSEVSEKINKIYKKIFKSIKVDIASVKKNGFGLTSNIWTDNFTNESYIALTIHYLENGVLTYRLLGFQALADNLSGDHNISEIIADILEEFNCQLSDKCILVSDTASHFNKSLTNSLNLPCISQLLNNMILNSVEKVPKVSEMLNACFKLINFLKKKRPDILSSKLTLKCNHNRFLAIYEMLNFILVNWQKIEQSTKETKICSFSKNQLMAIIHVLQPFKEAIETLEDDSQPTLHLVMACLHELTKFFSTPNETYNHLDFIKSLQEIIYLNLSDIMLKDITAVHKVAVFLYPPTNKLLPYSDNEKQAIEDECMRLMKNYTNDTKPLIKQEPDIQPLVSPPCKRKKLLADFLESAQNYDPIDLIKEEIQNYKNSRVILTNDFDVSNWWELQKGNFPLLYKLSLMVLATPATSTASKRILLNARSLVSEKYRDDSTDTDIEKVMFISTNAPGIDKYFSA